MTYYLHPESALKHYPKLAFVDFFDNSVTHGNWQCSPLINIRYAYMAAKTPKACIVIFPGRAEALVKYAELMYELHQNSYSVFIIDHRGQGGSSRQCDNPHLGYVESFDNYVEDAKHCLDKVLQPLLNETSARGDLPVHLLCHSMGSAIGALFVAKYPNVFAKAAFSAPMFGIKMPLPEELVKQICLWMIQSRRLIGLSIRYFWGQGDYRAYPFHTNRLTSSKMRYQVFRSVMAKYPNCQLGGISFEWLYQAILAMQALRRAASTIALPVLILQAEQDKIVDNGTIRKIANRFVDATFHTILNAEHEILFEQDAAKHAALCLILDHFSAQ